MTFTNVPKSLEGLAHNVLRTTSKHNPRAFDALKSDSIDLSFGAPDVDLGASMSPLYVADSNIGKFHGMTPQMEALFKQGKVGMRYAMNEKGTKWDVHFAQANARNLTGDSFAKVLGNLTMDAAGPLIGGSLLSPNSINWITKLFKQPLSWSRASDLVSIETGTNPWAETQAMAGVIPSGWGQVSTTGTLDNTMSDDVEAQLGMLTQQIINIAVTYKLTIAEMKRAESEGQEFPLAGQAIAYKQSYAKWIGDIIRDSLIYYGNAETGNAGLFDIDTITAWTSVGSNQALNTIAADGANTNKGSDIYQQFAAALRDFLGPMQNKASMIKVRMSVDAFNIFASVPYSDVYNPANAAQISRNSFDAGKDGVVTGAFAGIPFEVAPDPMLNGSGKGNFFNSHTYDYLVISANEVTGGPDDETQSLSDLWRTPSRFCVPDYSPDVLDSVPVPQARFGCLCPLQECR